MIESKWNYQTQAGRLSSISGKSRFESLLEEGIDIALKRQLLRTDIWKIFVRQFEIGSDTPDGGWRGEYWGKMMRGGVLIYQHTGNEKLYTELEKATRLLLSAKRQDGVYSTYALDNELFRWDVWCRKYVMLGLLYFLEICKDKLLNKEIISALKSEADGLLEKIGPEKIGICETSNAWGGINSCSVLEPMVRLYVLTKEKKYLDFATYIVGNAGGTGDKNIFELALKNEIYPHEYPVKKAYEVMSCFEGLLEYYFVTGEEKWKTAVVNFVQRVKEMEVSVIGCCGSEEELFNGCTKKQCVYNHLMQETCVTVTWMKLCYRVAAMSGDVTLADEIERSLYNAMLGAVNFKDTPENGGLPFDSYTALTYGTRAKGVGGMRTMEYGKFYGCCASIGSAGLGIGADFVVMQNEAGPVFQTYQTGTISYKSKKGEAEISVDTAYPYDGMVKLHFKKAEGQFALSLRIPTWCEGAKVSVNGKEETAMAGTYAMIERVWQAGDTVSLLLPMKVRALALDKYVTFLRGSIVLARDVRFDTKSGNPLVQCLQETSLPTPVQLVAKEEVLQKPDNAQLAVQVTLNSGEEMILVDFASAGQTWNQISAYEVWIKTTEDKLK